MLQFLKLFIPVNQRNTSCNSNASLRHFTKHNQRIEKKRNTPKTCQLRHNGLCINGVFTTSNAEATQFFRAESYQTQMSEVEKQMNKISVLDTGSGKIVIAVILIREIGRRVRENGGKVLIVFLAPTVDLVHQQYEVIRDYSVFDVSEYCGDKGVDEWTDNWWKKELNTNEIMVMAPQILLDALRHGFMALHMVHLLILGECHRANGSHPYAILMKGFPQSEIEKQVSELEGILGSKMYTVKDRDKIEIVSASAKEIHKYYDPNTPHFADLETKLEAILAKIDGLLINQEESPSYQFKDTSDLLKTTRKNFFNYQYCLDNLGLVCECKGGVTSGPIIEHCKLTLFFLTKDDELCIVARSYRG